MQKKDKPHNFYIDNTSWEKFKIYCVKKHKSASDILREFVKSKIKNIK